MVQKDAGSILEVLKDILKNIDILSKKYPFSDIKPYKEFYSDAGSEFQNKKIKQYLQKNNFHQIILVGDVKAFFAERVIRTLSNLASSMQQNLETFDIFKDLKFLQDTYNKNYHSTIKTTPFLAISKIVEPPKWKNLNIAQNLMPKDFIFNFKKNKALIDQKMLKSKFKPLDVVRLSTKREQFAKRSISEKWTNELFMVKSIHRPVLSMEPLQFSIIDLRNQQILGRFYPFELKMASYAETVVINSIVKYEEKKIFCYIAEFSIFPYF